MIDKNMLIVGMAIIGVFALLVFTPMAVSTTLTAYTKTVENYSPLFQGRANLEDW